MPNIFKSIAGEQAIFLNEDVLSPEFLPENLPGREAQEKELAIAFKPAAEGGRPANVFLHGPSGTGKTSVCKAVLAQLQEYSRHPLCVYVNCWQYSTRQAVLTRLAQAADDALPRRGLASDEVFERVCRTLKQSRRVPIVVLDEADRLFSGGEEKILYDFSRALEVHSLGIGLALVTNDSSLLARADARTRSSLSPREIVFKPYSPLELKKILSDRAALAFSPRACGDEVIALCAAHGAKAGGDGRVALQALWLAGRNAEARGAKSMSLDDARKAFAGTQSSASQKRRRDLQLLDEGEQKVVELLRELGGSATTTQLYELFSRRSLGSERSVRNYVQSLEQKAILESTADGGKRLVKLIN